MGLTATFSDDSSFIATFDSFADNKLPDYTGSYTAQPSWDEQTFATDDKSMTDDFTVNAILALEVSNPAGGLTLTI